MSSSIPPTPKLDRSHYAPWLLLLTGAAVAIDADDHVKAEPTLPTDLILFKTFNTKLKILMCTLIGSIPNDTVNLLNQIDHTITPYQLISRVQKHLDTSNVINQRFLKSVAEQAVFPSDDDINSHLAKHETIRAPMLTARYH